MPSAVPTFAPAAVQPNAWRAFGGVWRLTLDRANSRGAWGFIAAVTAFLGFITALSVHNHQPDSHYHGWIGVGYLSVILPVLAFLGGAGLAREDARAVAADYLFTRPVRRSQFVLFRFISHLVCVQVHYLVPLGVVVAIGVFADVSRLTTVVPAMLGVQVLVVTAFSALGFLAGSLTRFFIVLGILHGGLIEGALGNVGISLSKLSILMQTRDVYLGSVLGMGSAPVQTAIVVVLAYTLVAVALSALIVSTRELAGSRPKDAG